MKNLQIKISELPIKDQTRIHNRAADLIKLEYCLQHARELRKSRRVNGIAGINNFVANIESAWL